MYRGWSVAVVVPAYNEEGFVGDVLDALPPFVDRAYVVDDASTDGTWAEIRERAAAADGAAAPAAADGGGRVVALRHERNRGAGGAIVTGYRRALSDGMDVTAVVDGDGQMDPALLPRFLDPVVEGRADYAKGDRLSVPAHRGAMSRWRLFGNALLTGLTRVATGLWSLTDPQNGYTAASHAALSSVDLDALYEGHGFRNDLLAALSLRGARVADVPMAAAYGDEDSTISYPRFVPGLSWLLLRAFLRRLVTEYAVRELHPLLALYALGALGPVAGAVAAATGAGAASVALLCLLGAGLLALGMALDREASGDRVVRAAGEDGAAVGVLASGGGVRAAGPDGQAGPPPAGAGGDGRAAEAAAGDGVPEGDMTTGPTDPPDGDGLREAADPPDGGATREPTNPPDDGGPREAADRPGAAGPGPRSRAPDRAGEGGDR